MHTVGKEEVVSMFVLTKLESPFLEFIRCLCPVVGFNNW